MSTFDFDGAIEDCDYVINLIENLVGQREFKPDLVNAYYYRGLAYYTKGEVNSDKSCFWRASDSFMHVTRVCLSMHQTKLCPSCAKAYSNRGWVHRKMDDCKNAEAYFAEAKRLNPDCAETPEFFSHITVEGIQGLRHRVEETVKNIEPSPRGRHYAGLDPT